MSSFRDESQRLSSPQATRFAAAASRNELRSAARAPTGSFTVTAIGSFAGASAATAAAAVVAVVAVGAPASAVPGAPAKSPPEAACLASSRRFRRFRRFEPTLLDGRAGVGALAATNRP